MKVSEGVKEDGIEVGNHFDKYGSSNPIVKWMMNGFDSALMDFQRQAAPKTIHEVGCGEGYWVMQWLKSGLDVRGSDFSEQVIEIARSNAQQEGLDANVFSAKSVYDLKPEQDSADLIVMCEVLEHLEYPEKALEVLQSLVGEYLIVSVPREPVWCALNLARGKYIRSFGNTPGHIQHWSSNAFRKMVAKYFDVIAVRTPLPWTMLLCKPLKK
jgi:2-polyprenyl-3-methyl-5-hydroxy-6-metoxy-1,4-benzoquinol methylase